jgi:hypothetical protein
MKTTTRKRRGVLALLPFLAGVALAATPFAPAKADSGWCSDGWPSPITMQLVSGDFGLPLWLGFESYALNGEPGNVLLCYGTGAPGDDKTAGGYTAVRVVPTSNGADAKAENTSDQNSANKTPVKANTTPTYTVKPGLLGGQQLTVTIPFTVCSGPCQPGTQPADGQTGVVIGTLTRDQSTFAVYQVDALCLQVDGTTLAGNCSSGPGKVGVDTTGTSPTNISPGTPGPCVLTACAPNYNYIGTTGNQIAWVYVPGLPAFPVYGVHTCLYTKDASTTCPS